jgi:predicted SprT family Zn-dependent metalloprotease
MSTRAEAASLAAELMRQHGLHDWGLVFNRRKKGLGLCVWPCEKNGWKGRIELSAYYIERNPIQDIRDTILHEIAHALAGPMAGHGVSWMAKCRQIGAKPERCKNGNDVSMPLGKWQARCSGCGALHHRHRKPRLMMGWHCRICGPTRGALVWQLMEENHAMGFGT